MLKRLFIACLFIYLSLNAFSQAHSLDFYLNTGIQNSPLLNDFKNQLYSSTRDSLIIHAAKQPFVEGKSQLLYSPSYHNFGYDDVITDGGNYTAVLSVSQNIFNKKEIHNKLATVDIQKQLVNISAGISVRELKKLITDQYLNTWSAYTELSFNKTFLDLINSETAIVKQFVQSGVNKQTDYLALLVEKQSQEILLEKLGSQYRKEYSALNLICGISDSVQYELEKPDLAVNGTADISKSPSYIKYKIDSARIETEKSAIDVRYKPKVNWFADAGFLTSYPWNFYRHFGYSAGLSLNLPVYDGKQRNLEKQKLESQEYTRQFYESNYQKQYFLQVQEFNNELKSLDVMAKQSEKQLITAGQLVKALKEQLESGFIQITEYISAIKNYKTINSSINQIYIQRLQIINELNFLLTK